MEPNDAKWEEFKVAGDQLVSEVRRLVQEGNVRRIIVKDEHGRTLVELPLTVGVVGALLVPVAAALGAIAAIASEHPGREGRREEDRVARLLGGPERFYRRAYGAPGRTRSR